MPDPRFFLSPDDVLCAGAEVALPAAEAHHARRVLRLRAGARVELADGAGRVARAVLAASDRDAVVARIETVDEAPRSGPALAVAFAPPKGKRQAATVEALVELGVDTLIPLLTERGVAGGGDLDKWRARAVEAAKQCRRAWLPTVEDPATVEALAGRVAAGTRAFLAAPDPSARTAGDALADVAPTEQVLWLIGPEGGFTDAEDAQLRAAGAVPVRLGPHILRIGTAAALAAGLTRALVPPA